MKKTTLPYIHEYTDRHGKVRRYVRRPAGKVVLRNEPSSSEFLTEYQAALERLRPRPANVTVGSWDALITTYLSSGKFKNKLKPASQAENRREAERIRKRWGQHPVARLESRHILEWQDELAAAPGKANNMLAAVKMLLTFGKPRGYRHNDPAAGIEELAIGELRSWTDSELEAFERTWSVGTRERLIYALALYTGQRRGDLLRMTRAHIDGDSIGVVQAKTGERLRIPMHPELKAALAAAPSNGLHLIQRLDGKPLKIREAHDVFTAAMKKAELEGCVLHGLRKAAARRLADAGCSAHEIMAITGHRTLGMVQKYTRGASQTRLAKSAMVKLERKRTEGEPG